MNSKNDLNHCVALVTGGNGGLGLAMALALKQAGAQVIVCGRDQEKLKQAQTHNLIPLMMDVGSEHSIRDGFKTISDQFERLDILINNAGFYEDQHLSNLSLEHWEQIIRTNLTSAFLCSQSAAHFMKAQRRGKIINVGSMYSLFGHPNSIGYATTKTGILGLTRSLALELGPWNIQVNAILPGWFETAINGSLPQTARGEEIRKKTPLGKWGKPQDIGPLAVFLSSSGSDFITGSIIPIDGGYSVSDRAIW
ncbi:acetyoacetyl CoA reductase [Legionella steigerwaltii]|uniref:Acetyoacetyl CoA reductase n=1 Tax=Legionella steigerwaltii TaxID=460 RepID=A0A378L8R2_9GAMM|nr:SDR family oxidoreductase [Legionella steigerwaltii]KTD76217.1 acetyoacetyl CoA reductase [Legionella steigerwaltii]STY22302.1 acetyoacetyl CoA reductase [Legionella steigerwaltii]